MWKSYSGISANWLISLSSIYPVADNEVSYTSLLSCSLACLLSPHVDVLHQVVIPPLNKQKIVFQGTPVLAANFNESFGYCLTKPKGLDFLPYPVQK